MNVRAIFRLVAIASVVSSATAWGISCNPEGWNTDTECLAPTVELDRPAGASGCGGSPCGYMAPGYCSGAVWETATGGLCDSTARAEANHYACRRNAAVTLVEIEKFWIGCEFQQGCQCIPSSSSPPTTRDVEICTCEDTN